ncbi:NERD domain-containing protein [Serratia proteamaculans]|uniref:NERD domain-containing protein n=2 Tax=Serratia proteamaculans TaxID=28151 RepID=UPI001C589C5E
MTTGPASPPRIRIFIGSPLEHQSELDSLRAAYAVLMQSHCWAYVFANFNVSGRQLDLVIFTETTTLVIEAKGYTQPIRGGMNGPWEQRGPYGTKKIGNAYDQVLGAKNALRDEMQRVTRVDGYPNGLVAIMPNIPVGSCVTSGDFKAAVGSEQDIAQMLTQRSGAILTEEQCEVLSRRLCLEAFESVDAALNERMLTATRSCAKYITAFAEFYGPLAIKLLGDQYEHEASVVALTDVQSMAAGSAEGILIRGPSGCGKTLLTTACAISCLERNCIPIFVSAKDFKGQLQDLLDREVALLNSRSARSIVSASKLLGKRIMLFIDGYNECRDDLKVALTRSFKAFALRFGAGLVVSSQQDLFRSEILSMKTIIVMRPSDELKASLARIEELGDRAGNCTGLLQAARSGLEAELVGKAGSLLTVGASRFALFDAYSRIKLGIAASEGIRVLSAFASVLATRACFSLSIREFDRLGDSVGLSREARDVLFCSQLLYLRGDRVSFVHELFYAAFAAEAVIRSAGNNVSQIQSALNSPRFHSSRSFIIGSVEDDRVAQGVLETSKDQDLLTSCCQGECGVLAQSIVKCRIDTILDGMVAEAQGIEFELTGEGWDGVTVVGTSLRPDIKDCHSYLQAIGQSLTEGQYFDAVMDACKYMDEAIANAAREFSSEAKLRKIPLRHALFSQAYVIHHAAGISQLVNFIHSGHLLKCSQQGREFGVALKKAWLNAETPGQFYFLTRLTRFSEYEEVAVPYVVQLLQNIRLYPYHLQLDLIDFARHQYDVEDPYRTEMIDALQASLDKLGVMMNTMVFEALHALGALQEAEYNHLKVVRHEIADALGNVGPEADRAAWGVFSCQFDHPFDSSYWEEVQNLDDVRKKLLLIKACRGAVLPYISFLSILIRQLSEFNDPSVAYAIAPWTFLPDKKHFMPQDAIEVFVTAHESLGHLGVELPESRGEASTNAECALLACGELFYWLNRRDVKHPQSSCHTNAARIVLLNHYACASVGAFYLTTSRMISAEGGRKSLVNEYPDLAVTICREALKRREAQISFYKCGFQDDIAKITIFSIQILGGLGDRNDLNALRDLCDDESYGVDALDAIKKIEARTSFKQV